MKIVITGATGLLGSALVEHFEKNHFVFPFMGLKDLDIIKYADVAKKICDIRPDLVIHSAGIRDLDACELNPENTYLINTLGTRNMVNASREAGAVFAYISSNSVFDGKIETAYTEFDRVNPISVYGRSKLLAEYEVRTSGNPSYIFRVPYLFGEKGHPERNYVHKIVTSLRTKTPIYLAEDQKDNPTYVRDLCLMIETVVIRRAYGTYHLGNKGTASRYDFAVEIARILDINYKNILIPKKIEELERNAPRPANTTLSTKVYETIFNYNIRHWKDALADCLEAFKAM